MIFNSINWFAVVACFIFSIVSGSLWFGPKTFFPMWWKAIGKQENQTPHGEPLTWILLMVSSAVQAIFMAVLVNMAGTAMGGVTPVNGMTTGFMIWFGFVASSSLGNKLFPGYLKAWVIENGNNLLNYVAFGFILGIWR